MPLARRSERDVIEDRQVGEERVVLGHVTDVALPGRPVQAALGVGILLGADRQVAPVEPVEAGHQT